MARTAEFYRDPDAPLAEGVLPAAFAVVRDRWGQVLLVRRADDLNWELPGGRIDVGESAVQAVVREVAEEAGLGIVVTGLAGVYSDPSHVLVYAAEGARQQLALCFHARPEDHQNRGGGRGGSRGRPRSVVDECARVRPDGVETVDVRWAYPDALDGLAIHPAVRQRVDTALSEPFRAHFE
jgi:8-oxo-dGTP pyrophosphatase MutT (NUDIX family)